MANKKKNSNYVTDKTIAAKEAVAVAERKKKIKKTIVPIVTAFLVISLIVGAVFAIGVPLGMLDYNPEATDHVAITIEGYDESIHVELYGNDAPVTVKHFLDSLEDFKGRPLRSLKDGLLYFGSVSADNGTGGIKGEFSDNGYDNDISIRRGVIAAARGEDYNSGGSQYFIATRKSTDLNGKYAAFAKITSGMNVIESILENIEVDESGNITNPPKIESITTHSAHSH